MFFLIEFLVLPQIWLLSPAQQNISSCDQFSKVTSQQAVVRN